MTFQKPHIYDTKKAALKDKNDYQILGSLAIKKFFLLDNYQDFVEYIRLDLKDSTLRYPGAADFTSLPLLYEYTHEKNPTNLFNDVEIWFHKTPDDYKNYMTIVRGIISTTEEYLRSKLNLKVKTLVLPVTLMIRLLLTTLLRKNHSTLFLERLIKQINLFISKMFMY